MMTEIVFPYDFEMRMQSSMNDLEWSEFKASHALPSPTSIRINPHKYLGVKPRNSISWCALGFYLDERPIFTLDPLFHGGAYYVQEASSMYLCTILEPLIASNKDLRILDLSAAPGGKSTLTANLLNGQGLLVANEIVKNRAYTLKYNLSKEGYDNVVVSNNPPEDFSKLKGFFDVILVDAPCSGEGMFRKDPEAMNHWSMDAVSGCALRQKEILTQVIESLKSGGTLIYSTCTYNEDENINIIKWLVNEKDFESIPLTKTEESIHPVTNEKASGLQFYPHRVQGEGFFIATLKKNSNESIFENKKHHKPTLIDASKTTINVSHKFGVNPELSIFLDKSDTLHAAPSYLMEDFKMLSSHLRLIYCGITLGTAHKDIFIPDHSLALALNGLTNSAKDILKESVSKTEALLYLKKELPSISSTQKSWRIVSFQGISLGWIKNIGNRINNYLPNEYKIRMNISEDTK